MSNKSKEAKTPKKIITIENDSISIEGKHTWCIITQAYTQFLKPKHWNWLTFTFYQFEVEWERWLGRVEVTIAFMGIAIYFSREIQSPEAIKNRRMLTRRFNTAMKTGVSKGAKK